MTPASPTKRPGGRTARNTQAVRKAVLDLILEGHRPILVSDVATRAGVHATTLYRRWGSAEALVLEIAVERLGASSEIRSSGNLRDDLLAYAARLAHGTKGSEGSALLHAVVAACAANQAEAGLGLQHVRRRGLEVQAMLDRHPGCGMTLDDIFDGLVAPIYMRVLFGFGDIPQAHLEHLVSRLLAAQSRLKETSESRGRSPQRPKRECATHTSDKGAKRRGR
ncbi:MAG TPA: TetR/AcrR family transcriptional regulator C-terminal ligand-binding domain-containing protein [Polyangiaceae bacterium]|nr:TetR/AcrR family transcriptional regulator C-terminal ligand-binding domain-containing protein [Polyangiaceae bacterium]